MLLQACGLYSFFLLGSGLKHLFHIPLPGSIIGLLLLLVALQLQVVKLQWVESGSVIFLTVLPLYLLPATIGVMNFSAMFSGKGIWMVVITCISTILTLCISAFITDQIVKRQLSRKEKVV